MKILNVNNIIDPVTGGGTAERTLQLSYAMTKQGANCTIATLDIGVAGIRNKTGNVRLITLPCGIKRYFLPIGGSNIISDLVVEADIIQLMNHWTVLNVMVFHYARQLGKPYVVCPAGGIPVFGKSKMLKNIYDIIVGKTIIGYSKKVIAISRKEIEDLQKYGVKPEKIIMIPNGVDVSKYHASDDAGFRMKYGIPGEAPFLLFMGRLNAIKGPDLLLEAFIRMTGHNNSYHLVFAGPDAGMLQDLKNISLNAGIEDRVHFIGYVGGTDKSHALHAADILVIPSRREAMSIVVLEAGAAGIPVIITDQCGFNDIAGINGGIVTDATSEGIYKGIITMLANPGMIQKTGENLRKYVAEKFQWDNAARLYLDLFEDILKERS